MMKMKNAETFANKTKHSLWGLQELSWDSLKNQCLFLDYNMRKGNPDKEIVTKSSHCICVGQLVSIMIMILFLFFLFLSTLSSHSSIWKNEF